ncbi:MAG: CNNM domain-containing protein [Patescibacteria group bacterium]
MILTSIITLIVSIIVFLFLSGWFSGIETALINLTPSEIALMKAKKEKNITFIIRLKKNIEHTLITILIGNNIVNIALSAIVTLIANNLFSNLGVSLMIGLVTFLVIVFGEITPKSRALGNAKKMAQTNARRIYYLSEFLKPLVALFIIFSRWIILLTGGQVNKKHLIVTDDSIKHLATLGEEEGVIKEIEKDIIHKVFRFGDVKIRDIMVPMAKVFCLAKNYHIKEAKRVVAERGYTRVPIMTNGKITGILNSKDLILRHTGKINSFTREPLLVRDEDEITKVFKIMKRKRIHVAIVENVKRDHIGIVTLEDIIEELVGEIKDEYFTSKFVD